MALRQRRSFVSRDERKAERPEYAADDFHHSNHEGRGEKNCGCGVLRVIIRVIMMTIIIIINFMIISIYCHYYGYGDYLDYDD